MVTTGGGFMGLRKRLKWLLGLGSLVIGLGLMSAPPIANADSGASGNTAWTSLDNTTDGIKVAVPGTAPTGEGIELTETVPLFDETGAIAPTRRIAKGSAWYTNQVLINLATEKTYYRITNTEYVDTSDVDLKVESTQIAFSPWDAWTGVSKFSHLASSSLT